MRDYLLRMYATKAKLKKKKTLTKTAFKQLNHQQQHTQYNVQCSNGSDNDCKQLLIFYIFSDINKIVNWDKFKDKFKN